MARMKEVTNVQSRLFQFWVFASLIYGAAGIAGLGVSLLGGGALVSMLLSELLSEVVGLLGVAWRLIYLWFLFQALTFARNNGDSQIRRPLVWLLLAFVPISSAIVAWAVLPRIMPPWIKQMSRVSVSSRQVLVITVLTELSVSANVLSLGSLELIWLGLQLSVIAKVSLVWMLRDVLLGRNAN